MPRPKKPRGRPLLRKYPPRIDATAEEMAQAMFALPANHKWQYMEMRDPIYRCAECSRVVNYPDTLFRDGRCKECQP